MASCTKTEVYYGPSEAIAIKPVTGTITKGAVQGAPTGQQLSLYANYTDGRTYLDNALFAEKVSGSGIWEGAGDNVYFWPKSGQIQLAGHTYIPSSVGTPVYNNTANTFVVNPYIQPLSTSSAVDFLWFNKTNAVNNTATGDELAVNLQHAMTWVTINAYGVSGSIGWKIKSVSFLDVLNKGTLTCKASGPEWQNVTADTSGADLTVYSGTFTLSATPQAVENPQSPSGILLLPQTPTQMSITYETAGGSEITKPLDLKISDVPADNKWEAGKHYVYNLLFNPYKIEFTVNVDNSWTSNGEITIN